MGAHPARLYDFQVAEVFRHVEVQLAHRCPGCPVGLLHVFCTGVEIASHLMALFQVGIHAVETSNQVNRNEGADFPAFAAFPGLAGDGDLRLGQAKGGNVLAILTIGTKGAQAGTIGVHLNVDVTIVLVGGEDVQEAFHTAVLANGIVGIAESCQGIGVVAPHGQQEAFVGNPGKLSEGIGADIAFFSEITDVNVLRKGR